MARDVGVGFVNLRQVRLPIPVRFWAVAACDDEALAARATQEDLIGARVAVEGRTFTI